MIFRIFSEITWLGLRGRVHAGTRAFPCLKVSHLRRALAGRKKNHGGPDGMEEVPIRIIRLIRGRKDGHGEHI